ncbi:hypothetical protein AB4Z48_14395 [Cupriavidus sp. 2TAF22]|uniref:hypothetical protein n=1 Tax=unclassified Cupriavidus TaxID=2640874 RepID=UPI003F902D78
MQKLSLLTLCLLAVLAGMTMFICLSGAFTVRDTEYGSGTAILCYFGETGSHDASLWRDLGAGRAASQ